MYKCWKRGIGLKVGHGITRMASYTTVTTNENSDHWARFRSDTDVPYHRVSIDTIFHLQSKTLVHSAELSTSLFSATVHQLALIGIVQSNVIPTFQKEKNAFLRLFLGATFFLFSQQVSHKSAPNLVVNASGHLQCH